MRLIAILTLVPQLLWAANFDGTTTLTPAEKAEVTARIQAFYGRKADPSLMDYRPPKFSLGRGAFVHPRRHRGRHRSQTDAAIEGNDLVENLLDGWIAPSDTARDLAALPLKGQIAQDVWSGDYWQMRWGLTSYRPATGIEFETYQEAIDAYAQPGEWTALLDVLSPKMLADTVLQWSPAEKYDLTVFDRAFTLTNEQKGEGEGSKDEDGNVPDWIGLCDGWAAASLLVPEPKKPVDAVGPNGVTVTWYPDDIRALATLSWANGDYDENFIGGRCEEKDPQKYPNGRISAQDCFDTSPATFHLAIANLIGRKGQPFLMDVAFDAEIWNQPVLGYEMTYFNPLAPDQTGTDWTKLAVPYDAAFKAKDRFQEPLTRGVRDGAGHYDDSAVRKIVGVIATVVYLDEADPHWGPNAAENATDRVTYTYDLELAQREGKWVPTGGEWQVNDHPDFLWLPRTGAVASSDYDSADVSYALGAKPDRELTRTAQQASDDGAHPLCPVLKALVEASSGGSYACPEQ